MTKKKTDKYTLDDLKSQFANFAEAKKGLGIKARSWQALIDKLNQPTTEDLISQLTCLQARLIELENENNTLKLEKQKSTFDEVGFWLLDRNFDRSKFEDFEISQEATEIESKANEEYKRLARIYHPDNGGSDEQMSNLNKLKKQMLSFVKLNGGIGL